MINRALWTGSFQREYFPAWTCSKCEIGIFKLIPEHFYYTEDADTLAEINNPHFDYELVRYRFSSVLNCNNINCKETSILTGWGANEECSWEDENGSGSETLTFFHSEYCCPPPLIFKIPEQTPEEIKKLIFSSFSIFFSDPNSAANKLRCCLEEILKIAQIPQTKKYNKLASRLKKFCEEHLIDDHDFFNAIQFIGDGGSHGGYALLELNLGNILDAYEIIEFRLNEIYFKKNHHEKLKKISKKYPNSFEQKKSDD